MGAYDRAGPDRFRLDLAGENVIGRDLSASNYVGANLRGAVLDLCTLTGSDFTDADLVNASLRGANLANCILTGADLSGADLTGANLYGTTIAADYYGGPPAVPRTYRLHRAILDAVPVMVAPVTFPTANMLAWYKADTLTPGAVTTWPDSSPNALYPLTASDTKPTCVANVLNTLNSVRFDGAATYFTGSVPLHQPYTVFLVAATTSTPSNQYVIDGAGVNEAVVTYYTANSVILLTGVTAWTVPIANPTTPQVLMAAFSGATSIFRENNGSDVDANGGNPGEGNSDGITVGASGDHSTSHFAGDIFEILIYGTAIPSSDDRNTIVTYLVNKWGITLP